MTLVFDVDLNTLKRFKAQHSTQFFLLETAKSWTIMVPLGYFAVRTVVFKSTPEKDEAFRFTHLRSMMAVHVVGIHGIEEEEKVRPGATTEGIRGDMDVEKETVEEESEEEQDGIA